MDIWAALLDILILLVGAMALGGLFDWLKQSPLLGYLLAGTLLGPNALDLLPSHEAVASIAELGVALLLFTIGLEFSWRTLRSVGPIALGGGSLQVVLTGALSAAACMLLGIGVAASIAIGAMIALSSTAAVIRLLAGRAELDAVHGRDALDRSSKLSPGTLKSEEGSDHLEAEEGNFFVVKFTHAEVSLN